MRNFITIFLASFLLYSLLFAYSLFFPSSFFEPVGGLLLIFLLALLNGAIFSGFYVFFKIKEQPTVRVFIVAFVTFIVVLVILEILRFVNFDYGILNLIGVSLILSALGNFILDK